MRRRYNNRSTPTSALKEAEKLYQNGKPLIAQKVLHECLKHRRRQWEDDHEKVMLLYCDIAVENKTDFRKTTKEAFILYKNICKPDKTQVSSRTLDSLAKCLNYLVKKSETVGNKVYNALLQKEETAVAEAKAEAVGEGKVEELPREEKEILDERIRREKQKREKLQGNEPYLKYQHEMYRCVLDILRNNGKLDDLYQEVIVKWARYCERLGGVFQFGKLCGVCRKQLAAIAQHQSQENAVKLSDSMVRSAYLRTRFVLLEVATRLKLWQEAWKLITDITELLKGKAKENLNLDKALLSTYYLRLSQIFWSSKNYLLYGYSLWDYYILSVEARQKKVATDKKKKKSKKKKDRSILDETAVLTDEQMKFLKKRVILATLCILPSLGSNEAHAQQECENTRQNEMAEKLGFSQPNRRFLKEKIADLVEGKYAELVSLLDASPRPNSLFQTNPLTLCNSVSKLLDEILNEESDENKQDLEIYRPQIARITAKILLFQLSSVYKTISLERVHSIMGSEFSEIEMEDVIIECLNAGVVTGQIDQMSGSLCFSTPSMENSEFAGSLTNLGRSFRGILRYTNNLDEAKRMQDERRATVFDLINAEMKKEHLTKCKRNTLINQIKKMRQDEETRARKIETAKLLKDQKEKERKERELLEKNRKQAKEEMKKKIHRQQMIADAQKQAETIRKEGYHLAKTAANKKLSKMLKLVEKGDTDVDRNTLARQLEMVKDKEKKKQMQRKLEEKNKIDYGVRACRLEEIAILEAQWEKQKAKDAVYYEEQYLLKEAENKKAFKRKKRRAKKLKEVRSYYEEYRKKLDAAHERKYQLYVEDYERRKKLHEENRAEKHRKEEEDRLFKEQERERRVEEERQRLEREKKEIAEKEERRKQQLLKLEQEQKEREERRKKDEEAAKLNNDKEEEARRRTEGLNYRGPSELNTTKKPWRASRLRGVDVDRSKGPSDQSGDFQTVTRKKGGWREREKQRREAEQRGDGGDDNRPEPVRSESRFENDEPREPNRGRFQPYRGDQNQTGRDDFRSRGSGFSRGDKGSERNDRYRSDNRSYNRNYNRRDEGYNTRFRAEDRSGPGFRKNYGDRRPFDDRDGGKEGGAPRRRRFFNSKKEQKG